MRPVYRKEARHKACEAADQLLLVTTALSVVIMAAVYLLKPFILHVVFGNITAEVERNCNIYLMIVAASIPFLAVYNGCAAIFRAQGDSKTPMKISIVMNLINISGNALLVYALKSAWTALRFQRCFHVCMQLWQHLFSYIISGIWCGALIR